MSRFFDRFNAFDLVIIALMAALGVAVKPFVTAISHIITGPLFIPGGTVAGGVYMLFLVLGAAMVGKRGTATMIAAVQAILVVVTGIYGTHGIVSLITYALPGLLVDTLWMLIRHRGECALCCFLAGIVANITGTLAVNMVFFRVELLPLLIMIFTAALSGGLGGIIAWNINKVLIRYKLTGRGQAGRTGI